jgi:predicted  nucleic acid-binding Zn-ribbon protein
LPVETAKREKELDTVRKEVVAARQAVRDLEVRGGRLELNIKTADQELAKLEGRLNQVRTAAEFAAVKLQIQSTRDERGRNEEELIALLDQTEATRATVVEKEKLLAVQEKEHAEYLVNAERLRAERQAELAKVDERRAAAAKGLPQNLIDMYEKLFRSREGNAVVGVDSRVCQGCYTEITRNDEAQLIGRSMIVQCKSCARILYLLEH